MDSLSIWSNTLSVGAFLRRARQRRGLSIRALARVSGKDHKLLSEYERGVVSPSMDTLAELCKWYEVEPWEAVLGQTRAELIASLPAPPESEIHKTVVELIAKFGQPAVEALLLAARELSDADEFAAAVKVYRALIGK